VAFRCQNGVRFFSGSGGANQQISWEPGDATWTLTSDRNAKNGFAPVDGEAVLDKVASLPIQEWNYIGYGQRHMGPMAQDFRAAFGLGRSDTAIDGGDLHGVALASIQGLHRRLQEKDRQLAAQERELDALRQDVRALHARLDKMESR